MIDTQRFKTVQLAGMPITDYIIVHESGAAPERAANELCSYLEKTVGMKLSVSVDAESSAKKAEILVGKTNRESSGWPMLDRTGFTGMAEDGFIIAVKDGRLILTGANHRGTFYAVYEFLEQMIGWRFFADDCEVLTGPDELDIAEGTFDCQKPVLEYRDTHWNDYYPVPIRVKRKLNTGSKWADTPDETWGGTFEYAGTFSHTMCEIIPEIGNGEGQPCYTDPAVLERAIAWVRKTADAHPGARIVPVTQNDNWNYCQCERCQKVYDEEGSPAGVIIRLANAVADSIRDDYPELSIDTFAYQWTRKAPLVTKPRENVIVRLCTGGECRNHRYDDTSCHFNQTLHIDIAQWAAITKRLFVWDYTTNFSYFLVPFANIGQLHHNLRWMRDNHMSGIFSQGNHLCKGTELGPLRAYLLAKIAWDPDLSDETYSAYMDDFLEGYYGAGWKNIRRYVDLIEECGKNRHVTIYGRPEYILDRRKYVSACPEIEGWFDAAEKAVTGEQRDRVFRLRLSHIFAKQWFTFDERYAKGGAERTAAVEEHRAYYFAVRAFGLRISEGHPFPAEVDFEKGVKSWYEPYEWELGSEFLDEGETL